MDGSWEGQCVQQAGVGTAQRMLSLPVSVSGQVGEQVPENTQGGERLVSFSLTSIWH